MIANREIFSFFLEETFFAPAIHPIPSKTIETRQLSTAELQDEEKSWRPGDAEAFQRVIRGRNLFNVTSAIPSPSSNPFPFLT